MGLIKGTPIYLMLKRAETISDAAAWYDAFQTQKGLQDEILEKVKQQLFIQNTDGNGEIIGRYSFYTSIINPEKVYNSPYTMHDTGEFYQSLFVEWFTTFINITGDGDKGDENLFDKYGSDIVDLTVENMYWLSEELKTRFINYVERILY